MKSQGPPCLLRFEPVYEREEFGGGLVIHALGRPGGDGTESACIEFSTDSAKKLKVSEGPFGGLTFSELYEKFGPDFGGVRTEELIEHSLCLTVRFAGAGASDTPMRAIERAGDCEKGSGAGEGVVVLEAPAASSIFLARRRNLREDRFFTLARGGRSHEFMQEREAEPGRSFLVPPMMPYALGRGVLAYIVSAEKEGGGSFSEYGSGKRSVRGLETRTVPDSKLYISGMGRLYGGNAMTVLFATGLFATVRLDLRSEWRDRPAVDGPRPSFTVLTSVYGQALLTAGGETEVLRPGSSVVVSARRRSFSINPGPGGVTVLKTWLPYLYAEIEKPLTAAGITTREYKALFGPFAKALD